MMNARVGSTLLMQLLGAADGVVFDRVYPYEHSYLTYLARLSEQLGQTDLRALKFNGFVMEDLIYGNSSLLHPLPFEAELVSQTELRLEALNGLWRTFSKLTLARCPDASHYAEKYWGELQPVVDAGIQPVVIDLVRDPRDVVASQRAFNQRHSGKLFGRPQAESDEQQDRVLIGAIAMRLAEMRATTSASRITVRYEDLLTDTEGTCAAISEVTGLSLDARTANLRSPSTDAHMTSASALESIGRWTRDLDEVTVGRIERRLGTAMAAIGYGD